MDRLTSHEYARQMQAAAQWLLDKPEFGLPAYETEYSERLSYFSDKEGFIRAAKALGGKKDVSHDGDYQLVTEHPSGFKFSLIASRDAVCRIVKPAQEAEYECEPLLTQQEEEEVARG